MYVENYKDLPTTLPLMPLKGGILVPRSELQLPISDLGHLSSVSSAIREHRYIGVVQSKDEGVEEEEKLPLFHCGCVGQVIDIQENEEDKLILAIRGICRFEIERELPVEQNCRRAVVSYKKYEADIVHEADFSIDRYRLINALKAYCKKLKIKPNWKEISTISNERLITMLMMICPFDSNEKQALLETVSYIAQSQLITSIIEMESVSQNNLSTSFVYH